MPFKLHEQEVPLYPQPFVETEAHLLVITTQRIVQFGDEGRRELPAGDVSFVARVSQRPFVVLGVLLMLVGLPLLVSGAWVVLTGPGGFKLPSIALFKKKPALPSVEDDPAGPPPEDDEAEVAADSDDDAPADQAAAPHQPMSKAAGLALGVGGLLLLAGGALAARKQRHLVLVRGSSGMLSLSAKDEIEQTQLLSTVQTMQTTAKAMAPAAAAAAAPAATAVQVDDGGDPLKALQELGAARAAGKVSDDEFHAKREVLLSRLKR